MNYKKNQQISDFYFQLNIKAYQCIECQRCDIQKLLDKIFQIP